MNHAGESVSAVQVRTECSTSAAPSCFFDVETGKVNATNYSVEEAQIPWKVARRYRLIWNGTMTVRLRTVWQLISNLPMWQPLAVRNCFWPERESWLSWSTVVKIAGGWARARCSRRLSTNDAHRGEASRQSDAERHNPVTIFLVGLLSDSYQH